MPKHSAKRASTLEHALQDHLAAAERALREVARVACSKEEEAGAERHADVVAQIQREFRERPLSEGAVGSTEAVDALLAGTDALRLKADDERHQEGRFQGSEAVAFDDYTAELRERVRQIHEILQAEYEQLP